MPIIKHNGKVVYYAHVPKCGGTSVVRFVRELVGDLSFHDPKYFSRENPWTTSSPQHVEWRQMEGLFSESFFDQKFTLVRDPVERLFSAFNYNKRIGKIPRFTSLTSILKKMENSRNFSSKKFDNHFFPANWIAPEDCKVFYLETGIDALENWLKDFFEIDNPEIRIEHHNKGMNAGRKKSKFENLFSPALSLESTLNLKSKTSDIIREIYSEDYERFDF